ncbi:hypothetical protein A3K72_01025 [Candidatus Woesearchaeota archaeon RBG_13_36_6]|nr:MAG: hypothetical protein A3K72_01025 [Candidatus Woesearchaeota archaeon RBG_13_36_6]
MLVLLEHIQEWGDKILDRFGLNKEYINLDIFKKIVYIVPDLPRQATVEITNICNLNCKMCPRHIFKRPERHMEFDVYKKIIDRLEGIEEIALIGYGETMLYPKLKEAIKYARGKGFRVTTVSNGYFLTKKKIFDNVLFSGINLIRFSIDCVDGGEGFGHKSNEDVLHAIEKLRVARDREGLNFSIIINPVVAKWNYEKIIPLIRWAERAGLDQVDLAHFNQIVGGKGGLSPDAEIKLYKKIKESNFKIKVTSLYDRYFGFRKIGFRFMTKCPMSYDVVYIRQDGGISPCNCAFPNVVYGNIFDEGIKNTWDNQKFKNFRKHQQKICRKCTLFKLYD